MDISVHWEISARRLRRKNKVVKNEVALQHRKRTFDGFHQHWNSLTVKERRIAEETAIENWDNPELLDFANNLGEMALLKKHLLSEWCSFACPSSAKTGIIVGADQLEALFKTNCAPHEVLWEFHHTHLFQTTEYSRYVLKVANEICLTNADGIVALMALRHAVIPYLLANGFSSSVGKQLSCVCKALQQSYNRNCRK